MNGDDKMLGNGLWHETDGKRVCYNPWTHFEVNNPNGDVTMCVAHHKVLGNVNTQSIEEIWNGPEYQKIRKTMFEQGGDTMCSPSCLLLCGLKNYQSFSWYKELPHESEVFKNAELNELEIRNGTLELKSRPRWMRLAVSYKCNYNCYHCYQEDDRGESQKLPARFIEEVESQLKFNQFLFVYGGEPMLFPEFKRFLQLGGENPHLRFIINTNGSLVHRHLQMMEGVNWGGISVSVDGASEKSYSALRADNMWETLRENLGGISKIWQKRHFYFDMSMTVNSVNCHEIYDFAKMAASYNALPKFTNVTNLGTLSFLIKYMLFTPKQVRQIVEQVGRIKREFNFDMDETGLNVLLGYFSRGALSHDIWQIMLYIRLKTRIDRFLPRWIKNMLKKTFIEAPK